MTVTDKTLKKTLPEFGYQPDPETTQQYTYALLMFWAVVLVF